MDDELTESRTADSNPLGKCTERLETMLPEQVKHDFIAVCGAHGTDPSKRLRLLIERDVYGELDRIRRMVGNGDSLSNPRNIR